MSTPTEEITVDLDAISGATGGEVAERSQVAPDGSRVAPKEPEIEVKTAPEPEKTPKKTETQVLTPDEGLERLKKQLEDEKNLRVAADNRARAAEADAARAKNESQGTQLDLVKSAIASLTQANDALEEKYAAALAAQDYAGAAKAQREMSSNEAKLNDLNRGKTAMENAPKATPRVADDPVERIAQQLTPQSAAWVRAHPEYARDPAKYRKMVAAHELAMADGFAADSPEYFASVEDTLRIPSQRQETVTIDTDATADAAKPSTTRPSRQTAPPSAPVSRSGNGTGGNRPNVVTLTPEQVEIAKMMQMTPEEYARQVVALKKEGKLN
jgi:hypothetical protein